jgi:hypothetical protein
MRSNNARRLCRCALGCVAYAPIWYGDNGVKSISMGFFEELQAVNRRI